MNRPKEIHDPADLAVAKLVEKKATCPFLGPAVAASELTLYNDTDNPLASIEEVRELGNTGGGDLGEVLAFFARGNHALMRGATGELDQAVPPGFFSLELPGSQGSHPGHSGILQGDPLKLNTGRFSPRDLARLERHATNGFLGRSGVGKFIAENLHGDTSSKVHGADVATLLARDIALVLDAGVDALGRRLESLFGGDTEEADRGLRAFEQQLTKLMGEDNLVGSAGEFGLLFAFLDHSPKTREIAGEPALSLDDVRSMFVDKRLPDGWDTWKKSRVRWIRHTVALVRSAHTEYGKLISSSR